MSAQSGKVIAWCRSVIHINIYHANHHNLNPLFSDLCAPSKLPSRSNATLLNQSKRLTPLVDLIDTEQQYVDQLTGIIRVSYSFFWNIADLTWVENVRE